MEDKQYIWLTEAERDAFVESLEGILALLDRLASTLPENNIEGEE